LHFRAERTERRFLPPPLAGTSPTAALPTFFFFAALFAASPALPFKPPAGGTHDGTRFLDRRRRRPEAERSEGNPGRRRRREP